MNPRFAKEWRPLLLPWSVALVIAIVISLAKFCLTFHFVEGAFFDFLLVVVTCTFFSLLLALAALPFGIEFQHQTFPLLLSQPTTRSRLWKDKLITAISALGSIILILAVGQWVAGAAAKFVFDIEGGNAAVWNWHWPREMTLSCCALLLPTLGSVGYWTLLTRSTLGGMVFTAVAQLIVVGVITFLRQQFGKSEIDPGFFGVAGIIYGVVFFVLSWRRFSRLELRQLSLDASAGSNSLTARPSRLTWLRCRPAAHELNLIRKEIQLQRPLFIIAAILCGLWLLAYILLILQPTRPIFIEITFVLTIGAYIPLVAVLAGTVSLGEEKNLGITAWHLTFPVSIWRQWASKLAVGFGVWMILGFLLPLALTRLALAIGGGQIFKEMEVESWFGISLFMTGVFALSFWAMTLFSNTVRAVLGSIITVVALCLSAALAYWVIINLLLSQPVVRTLMTYDSRWEDPMSWVVLGATTVFFALLQSYIQFRRLQTSFRSITKYCCALVAFLFFATTCYFLLVPFSHCSPIVYLLVFALLFMILRRKLIRAVERVGA